MWQKKISKVVTNIDGTVNVDGTLLNRFVDAYEKQISFQSRQMTLQEQMADLLKTINKDVISAITRNGVDASRVEGKIDSLLNRR